LDKNDQELNQIHKIKKNVLISFLVVVRNEENYISCCLNSILNQKFDPNLYEIIVVDGMSEDSTRFIVKQIINNNPDRSIRMMNNQKKILSSGWNIGINASKGKYIIRIDAHAKIPKDFLEKNIKSIEKHKDAWGVGGIIKTVGYGFWGQIIAEALSSPFGVGNSRFRIGGKPGLVDTIVYGLYKRDRVIEVGGFEENIPLNQDNLFHRKIHEKGGILYFDPSIKSIYFCRDSIKKLWKQMYNRSFWLMRIIRFESVYSFSLRHIIPLFFFAGILILSLASLFYPLALRVFLLLAFLYLAFCLGFSAFSSLSLLKKFCLPLIFLTIHFAYGIGSLFGLVTLPFYKTEIVNYKEDKVI